jgi:hypothetical protein
MDDLLDAAAAGAEEGEVVRAPLENAGAAAAAAAAAAAVALQPLHPAQSRRRHRSPSPRPPARGATERRLRSDLEELTAEVDAFERARPALDAARMAATARALAQALSQASDAARALQLELQAESEAAKQRETRFEELCLELRWLSACGACGRKLLSGESFAALPCGHAVHARCVGRRGRCSACSS